jgi:RNA polymerase sigma-32 factor
VTLESLGRRLGISKERVRQIEHHALKKLRHALERRVGDPRAAGLIG